jgi:hypothetical protein
MILPASTDKWQVEVGSTDPRFTRTLRRKLRQAHVSWSRKSRRKALDGRFLRLRTVRCLQDCRQVEGNDDVVVRNRVYRDCRACRTGLC